jgi:hypothetical protein
MRLVLHIDMNNDAFREDTGPEVARILRELARTVEHRSLDNEDCGILLDTNEVRTGVWEVIEGPTCPVCDAPLTHVGAPCPNRWLSAHH